MSNSNADIKSLGIIAGGGTLPEKLLLACDDKGIEPFIIGFEGQTEPALVKGRNHLWARLGAVGQVIKSLKAHNIRDVVMIGSIRRPSWGELVPDSKGAQILARIGLKSLGDSDLLSLIRGVLEEEGFYVHGVHKFADDLLSPEGVIGKHKPRKGDWADITRGAEISQNLGALDVGQSVLVQEGLVLGVEALEGTDELIRRCRHLKRKGRGGVLVKTCKPQQDKDLDLPTIGPETVRIAAECGLAGIAVHAGHSLLLERRRVAEIADKHKMFVIGINPANPANPEGK